MKRSSGFALLLALAVVPLALAPLAVAAVPDKEADEAIKTWKKAFATKDDKARVAAVQALAPVQHRWVAEALAGPLGKDAAIAVRVEAAKGLGLQWTPRAVEVLTKPLSGDDEIPHEVVLAIIDALGATESDAAVEPLLDFLVASPHAYRNSKAPTDTSTAAARAVAALKRTGSSKAVSPLVELMNDETQARRGGKDALMTGAGAALVALTGEKLRGAKAWREWWSANAESAKTWKCYRCETTGKIWDKVASDSHCPVCPAEKGANTKCSVFLRTRFVDSTTGDEPAKKGK